MVHSPATFARGGLLMMALAVGWFVLPSSIANGVEPSPEALAVQAKALLKTHCYRCHGVEKEVPGLDVLNVQALKQSRSDEPGYVVAGDADASLMWQRVGVDRDMPPEKVTQRPSDADIEVLRAWIDSGAPEALTPEKLRIGEAQVLSWIRNDQQNLARSDRRHQRYLSLHHASNNPRFDQADLRMFRAALSKLLNSLARTSLLALPQPVGTDDVSQAFVYRIDLRDYGWTTDQWQTAIRGYPYGLTFNDPDLQEVCDDIEELTGPVSSDGVPYLRIDWFVANASLPTVYHHLADVPTTAAELEQRLGVNTERDYLQDRLQRAGFASSGVSRHNRLIDRHVGAQTAYYYKSYDFSKSYGRSLLARYPLGPTFGSNTFAHDFAFEHDGGEIIWSMPNGMQGYMLIDQHGNRIDEGPIEIVRDLRETAGTPKIVNGISCIGCHRNGMLDYVNAIDSQLTLTGEARNKVDRLFVDVERMDQLRMADQQRFMNALQQVIGPFLQVEENTDRDIRSFAEPVRVVTSWYNRDMTLADAAAELDMDEPNDLASAIRTNHDLLTLGMGPLAIEQTVPRKMWDTLEESSASVFQRSATAIRIGSGVGLSSH